MPASQESLDAWVLATWAQAVAYARGMLRDRSEAEDVVHDCYCSLLRKAADYDLPADGRKLLFRAVTNACFKRNARRRPLFGLFSPRADGSLPADPTVAEPLDQAISLELERDIADALSRLPEQQRAALQLKCLDHTLDEIADLLAISPSNAGVLVHRARQALAARLGKHLKEGAE
ncbi:MAG: RNA polymerase sigma factor [Gemmataceae bacterium]